MAQLIADSLDFNAYLRDTECSAKVKPASEFAADMAAEFDEGRQDSHPEMFSTKLRGLIRFRPGEVTAWAGYNGHRKSLFVGQMAIDLCVQRQRVLIMSMEMSPARTLARMARQAAAAAKPSSTFLGAFASWSDSRLWIFDHQGRITPEQCIAVCRYFAQALGGGHVVIDSMMMVCASEESMDEQKQFVTDLVRVAQETGLHIHLVAHCRKPQRGEDDPPTKYDLRGSAAISDQCPNVITVWANKAKKAKLDANPNDLEAAAQPDALVTVEKQRNGEWEGRVKLWFDIGNLRFGDERLSRIEPYVLR